MPRLFYTYVKSPGFIVIAAPEYGAIGVICRTRSQFSKGVTKPYIARALVNESAYADVHVINNIPTGSYQDVRKAVIEALKAKGFQEQK